MTEKEIHTLTLRERLFESVRILGRVSRNDYQPWELLLIHITLQDVISEKRLRGQRIHLDWLDHFRDGTWPKDQTAVPDDVLPATQPSSTCLDPSANQFDLRDAFRGMCVLDQSQVVVSLDSVEPNELIQSLPEATPETH